MSGGNSEPKTRTIATFYSFKGGTGRTMALANIAFLLGRELKKVGEKVLAVDWDLEAPGLHRYFPLHENLSQEDGEEPGLIDYFRDLADLLETDRSLYQRIVARSGGNVLAEVLPLSKYVAAGVADGIDLMKAGRLGAGYQDRVASFDWAGLHRKYHRVFREIREQIISEYSWCLIDSRTGITDVSGVCTMLMPEKLVAVFTPNRQSVEGLLEIVAKAIDYRRESDDPRPLSVFPLPSRVITGELELSRNARATYRADFERCLKEAYGVDAVDLKQYLDEVEIPHKDYYGFSERVAVRDDPTATDALSINQAYQRFYDRLVRNDAAWEMPAAYTDIPKVYITSTSADLSAHRSAVRDAAISVGLLPLMTEGPEMTQLPKNDPTMSKVSESDLVVAIVAHRYGSVPPNGEKSSVWLDCDSAIASGKELVAFVVDENYSWPVDLREAYRLSSAVESGTITFEFLETVKRNIERLQDFKKWLRERTMTFSFTTPDNLNALASQFFRAWRERHPELGRRIDSPSGADPARYLALLRDNYAWIDVRGLQSGTAVAHRFPITDLFVAPSVSAAELQDRSALSLVLESPRLGIVGEPGSGKTALLRYLCYQLCRANLSEAPSEPLAELQGLFPILIRLPALANHIRNELKSTGGSEDARPGWIPHFLGVESSDWNTGLDEEFFRRKLADGKCLLLLDGLDEVGGPAERELLARLIENAASAYPECRFIVTTRPKTYVGLGVLAGFRTARIEPLESEAIESFLRHWFVALYPGSPGQAQRHFQELSEAALYRMPEIRRIACNPVMLTALAVMHWNERRLPEQRADLYESILVWLARAREEKPGRVPTERCLFLLQHLALAMLERRQGRQVQVSKGWAADALAGQFTDIEAALAFLEEEEVDSGIIVSRDTEIWFWHLTFQ